MESKINKIDIDKLKTVPVNLKINDAVDKDVIKNSVWSINYKGWWY